MQLYLLVHLFLSFSHLRNFLSYLQYITFL
uniref:Uncharacterized protein n=1 Tax=Siphoviridae sp. ctLAw30 TaxID=2826249 RepID=A0A8S5M1J3_9CAUD|nr:MAG TPA: hypothetical protein [Siphoviridae sp. ctLAw30]